MFPFHFLFGDPLSFLQKTLFDSLIQEAPVDVKTALQSQQSLSKPHLSFDCHEILFAHSKTPTKFLRNESYYMFSHATLSIDSFSTKVAFWIANGAIETVQFHRPLISKKYSQAKIQKMVYIVDPMRIVAPSEGRMEGWLSGLEVTECSPPLEPDRREKLINYISALPSEYIDIIGSNDGFVHPHFTLCGLREMNCVFYLDKTYFVLARFDADTRFALVVEQSRREKIFLVRLEDQSEYELKLSFRECIESLVDGSFTIPPS